MSAIEISTQKERLDFATVYNYLSRESYWARGIPEETLRRAIDGSLCFGGYETGTGRQVAFARVVTDHATFAYLCDVFVLPEAQGEGIGKRLIEAVATHLQGLRLRRWSLVTRDAHGLYERVGFAVAPDGIWMERRFPDVYRPAAQEAEVGG